MAPCGRHGLPARCGSTATACSPASDPAAWVDPTPGPTVAIAQGDTGYRFGWVPEIYLLDGGNDDPDGGLPVCTDARAARVT